MNQLYDDITKDLPPDLQQALLIYAADVRQSWRCGWTAYPFAHERIQNILDRVDNPYSTESAWNASIKYAETLAKIGATEATK